MKHTLQILLVAVLVLAMGSIAFTTDLMAGTITSTATGGKWSATTTWAGGAVPAASDDVVIANGATVTIDANVTVASITVGQGTSGTLTFENVAKRIVTVSGNVTVAAGGTFIAQTPISTTGDLAVTSTSITNVASTAGLVAGMNIGTATGIAAGTTVASFTANTITLSIASTNATALTGAVFNMGYDDTLSVGGNLINNGTFDMSRGNTAGICHVTFNKAGDQTISGTGATTRFRSITLSKVAATNKVISSINASAAGTPLAFVAGTWEQNAGRFTATTGTIGVGSASATSCGLNIIGSGSFSIFNNLNIFGSLLVNTTDSLIVGSGGSKIDLTNIIGASATFTKGTVVVYGKIATAAVTATTFNGANVIIDPKGFAALIPPTTDYSFRSTTGTGGTNPLTFTSGTITILNPNSATGANPELAASSSVAPNISGTSTFVLGQGANTVASAQGYRISLNNAAVLNNLTINTGTVGVALLTNVTVKGKLTITSCGPLSGTGFTWTAPNYVFNGNVAQVTGSIMPATVKNVTINNPAGVTSSQALTITDTLFLVSGTLSGPYTAGTTVKVSTDVQDQSTGIPQDYSLQQNYPNPFNPSSAIRYQLSANSFVSLKVFDMLGREVATLVNEVKKAGTYSTTWNAAGFGSGVYFCTMQAGSFHETKKLILMK
ncbi:MAG: T9SS type A sorting domain-containing protein [Ignavibacteria bacterium]|nr:T9SS type A sorting domain-containing protein [Ignavibacteria bacterium]